MRIISGTHKGRRIRAPKNLPVRPTTDMAKEGLFNILTNQYDFSHCTILDLFSGTGNIAYEFCSRGAKSVKAVDKDKRCVRFIHQITEQLHLPIQPIVFDVFSYLEQSHQIYDIIFADPPYDMEDTQFDLLVKTIFENNLLDIDGICIVEHSKHTDLTTLPFFEKSKSYGGNCFSFFQKKADL